MKCEPTLTSDDIDIPALREKYRQERDKRIRPEVQKQYLEAAVDNTRFLRECTPGYYNNEGGKNIRSHLGEPYGPGFYALEELLQNRRDRGDMAGLVLGK